MHSLWKCCLARFLTTGAVHSIHKQKHQETHDKEEEGAFLVTQLVKNPPANAGATAWIPDGEDPTCHGAAKPVHRNC